MAAPNEGLKGRYFDRLVRAGGPDREFGWRNNLIVDRCRELLAGFMIGEAGALGVQTLAFGRGEAVWDTAPPPPATPAIDQLVDPAPETIAASAAEVTLSYLDVAGQVTPTVTHRVQIEVTVPPGTLPIAPGDSAFPLREFALIGSLGGADFMINYIRHPVIPIAAADTFARTIRLVF